MEWVLAVASPFLIVLGGIIGAWVTHRLQESREIEERLSGERRKVYADLMKPYFLIFSGKAQDATKLIATPDYRRTAFDFMLIAPDSAAQAYNNLMQFTYRAGDQVGERTWEIMLHWGRVLLEIRKSLGNKNTVLSEADMLRFLIKDIDQMEREHNMRMSE